MSTLDQNIHQFIEPGITFGIMDPVCCRDRSRRELFDCRASRAVHELSRLNAHIDGSNSSVGLLNFYSVDQGV